MGQPISSDGKAIPSDDEDLDPHLLVVTPDKPLFSLTPSPKKSAGQPNKKSKLRVQDKLVAPVTSNLVTSGWMFAPPTPEAVLRAESPAEPPAAPSEAPRKTWNMQMLEAAEAEAQADATAEAAASQVKLGQAPGTDKDNDTKDEESDLDEDVQAYIEDSFLPPEQVALSEHKPGKSHGRPGCLTAARYMNKRAKFDLSMAVDGDDD